MGIKAVYSVVREVRLHIEFVNEEDIQVDPKVFTGAMYVELKPFDTWSVRLAHEELGIDEAMVLAESIRIPTCDAAGYSIHPIDTRDPQRKELRAILAMMTSEDEHGNREAEALASIFDKMRQAGIEFVQAEQYVRQIGGERAHATN